MGPQEAPPRFIIGSESPTSLDWTVWGPDGRWLGVCQLRDRFYPMEFGSDYVLGVTTDDSGVEYLELYPLIKP